mmetsp:Transcript_36799/g.106126  ORF Transcript_36799/g.106126 Transcript_36799/m.106126 type:complete len:426 (+) Transcript_36799:808-2085(+)
MWAAWAGLRLVRGDAHGGRRAGCGDVQQPRALRVGVRPHGPLARAFAEVADAGPPQHRVLVQGLGSGPGRRRRRGLAAEIAKRRRTMRPRDLQLRARRARHRRRPRAGPGAVRGAPRRQRPGHRDLQHLVEGHLLARRLEVRPGAHAADGARGATADGHFVQQHDQLRGVGREHKAGVALCRGDGAQRYQAGPLYGGHHVEGRPPGQRFGPPAHLPVAGQLGRRRDLRGRLAQHGARGLRALQGDRPPREDLGLLRALHRLVVHAHLRRHDSGLQHVAEAGQVLGAVALRRAGARPRAERGHPRLHAGRLGLRRPRRRGRPALPRMEGQVRGRYHGDVLNVDQRLRKHRPRPGGHGDVERDPGRRGADECGGLQHAHQRPGAGRRDPGSSPGFREHGPHRPSARRNLLRDVDQGPRRGRRLGHLL